jgi:DNA sulfur modification protein DndB
VLINLKRAAELRSLARVKARDFDAKSVHLKLIDEEREKGWVPVKVGKSSARLTRPKTHSQLLEDRVWTLLFKMDFEYLSDAGGTKLPVDLRNPGGAKTQIDVVGLETDIALAVECKSQEKYGKRASFQDEVAKLSQLRDRFARAANSREFGGNHRRHTALALFLQNVELSKNDRERADEAGVVAFGASDLEYYEKLTSHVGPAAKYQFFADMLPGKVISGLEIRVPSVRSKIGKHVCYSFPVSPEYLLKISYVSHRSKGKRSDVNTYQRMLAKSRLNKIRHYISEEGIFPTNIVVNLESKRLTFHRVKQENDKEEQKDSGVLGWLDIRPAYKSAWIIDGQHRLYSYSGHPRAKTSHLTVLAFEGLPPSKQAQLFIDINAKQKSVKQSLLQELFAELHWDSDKASVRVQAIISKTVQLLDAEPDSPLFGRIQTADATKDAKRCISLTSIFNAVEKTGFHIVKEKKGEVIEYGPLWAVENDATLDRSVFVLKGWLTIIRNGCAEWWDLGAADGGGLAMNDGITACINVLRSVFQHLEEKKHGRLLHLDDEDLLQTIKPYAEVLGAYFGKLSPEERKGFRELRGVQGQTVRTRRCQLAIKSSIGDFDPPGLKEFVELERQETNLKAKEITDRIERTLQRAVVEELRREFGPEDTEWWILGVPKRVRLDVAKREQDDDSRRGAKEAYFDLIDYRIIAMENWQVFEPLLAYGKSGNKEKRTKWMVTVNERRNVIAHPSSGVALSLEQLAELQEYERALNDRIEGRASEDAESEETEEVA